MSPDHFGNTEPARTLVKLLNKKENKKCRKYISRRINDYNAGLKEIFKLEDENFKVTLAELWLSHCRTTLANSKTPYEIVTFTKNVMTIRFRDLFVRRTIPYKRSIRKALNKGEVKRTDKVPEWILKSLGAEPRFRIIRYGTQREYHYLWCDVLTSVKKWKKRGCEDHHIRVEENKIGQWEEVDMTFHKFRSDLNPNHP